MKIAIIHPYQYRLKRGIEQFTWSVMGELSNAGASVDLLTWRWPNPAQWGDLPRNSHVYFVPNLRYFRAQVAIPFYAYWLSRHQYDWIMIFFAGYGEAQALAVVRRLRDLRVCIVFHFPIELVPHRFEEFQRLHTVDHARLLVAVSRYAARGVEAKFGRPCVPIANGVDADVFKPSEQVRATIRQQHGIADDTPVLITSAALEERKGIQWVLQALPALLTEFPALQYWVLGEGAYRAALQAEIVRLGLENCVRLLGRIDNVNEYLAAADVGALLSYGESFGIAVIEYMAAQLSVVVSQHPPFDEFVQPAWGYQVDERNAESVAQVMAALLRDPGLRDRLGSAGRAEVLQRYTWRQVTRQYLDLMSKFNGLSNTE